MNCSCASLKLFPPIFDDIVSQGKGVILRLRNTSEGQRSLEPQALEIDDTPESTPYIAISHVRSAGLGNPSGNSLPSCQVVRLQELVDEVASEFCEVSASFFWIDTLCLPRDKGLQGATLVHATHIFARAQAVLVHDPPLYQYASQSSYEDLMKIRESTWKQRLWTLEEGSVAKRLIFHFSNDLVDLDELLKSIHEETPIMLRRSPESTHTSLQLSQPLGEHKYSPRLVERFADDMKNLWKRRNSYTTPPELAVAKPKLKTLLRLSFLAHPRFRHFVDEDEFGPILEVWEALLRTYDGIVGEDGQDGDSTGGGRRDMEGTITRLKDLSLLDLQLS